MKSYLLLLALLPALPALAQTAPASPAAPVGGGRVAIGSDTPPEQLADRRTDLLVGQLNLTPGQTKQVYAAELTRAREHQALLRRLETTGWPGHDGNVEAHAIEGRFNQQLTAICTPAQNEKRRVMQARFRRLREADSLQRAQAGLPR